jgi:hypothetical protein
MPVAESDFVRAALEAFDVVARELHLQVKDTIDETWFAKVAWEGPQRSSSAGPAVRLSVTDDRRDRFVNVIAYRRAGAGERTAAGQLWQDDGWVSIPLWAIVEAAGETTEFAISGEHRIERLPERARAFEQHALPFVLDPHRPIDDVVAVVDRHEWASSPEGRTANRRLP